MLKNKSKKTSWNGTLIGQGTNLEGNIDCEANLRIEGQFTGEIHCRGQIIIGESGEVRSSITGTEIIVAGKVVGDITSQGRLTIMNNGQVHGNVEAARLVIIEGGLLNGTSKMTKLAEAPAPTPEKVKSKTKKAAQPEAG